MSIKENIAHIRAEIDAAARATGRTGADITLVGASKMNDAAACQEAIAAGIDVLGENRVQEMTEKLSQNAYDGAPLHFIGHLQRNKVKQVVGKVALIQSVSSLALLDEIEKVAAKMELTQDILLEVNVGGEEAKSGFAPEEVFEAVRYARTLPHISLRGLMTIPPIAVHSGANIPYFEKIHALFVDIKEKMYDNKWEYISMGMSDDYAEAIRCGANMVRVGSAIFGARNYTK
ncbi:MAG: YggS family pyridoxal phosphate-dependent enzyme [Oscillospiraceae bacterium]|nr:YggS family pyridoxal phosphate-dependent enzyme [Oscillospiraceae bacterium]